MATLDYLAGLFDGEGYVGVVHQRTHDCYTIRVSVANINRPLLVLFQEQFAGAIHEPRDYGELPGKAAFAWVVCGSAAMTFLRCIQPYVVLKRPQVDLALTFPLGEQGMALGATRDAVHEERRRIYVGLKHLKAATRSPGRTNSAPREELLARADVREAITLYTADRTASAVADMMKIKCATVNYWLREAGVTRSRSASALLGKGRSRAHAPTAGMLEARQLYESGLSASETARRLGKKPATVNYWLRQLGAVRSLAESQKLRREREAAA